MLHVADIIKAEQNANNYSEENLSLLLQRQSTQFFLEHLHCQIEESLYPQVVEVFKENTKICFTDQQVKDILTLFPKTRIKIAQYGLNDTEVSESINNCVSLFFLNCEWPIYKDNVDMSLFMDILHRQAIAMGYFVEQNFSIS